MALRDHLTLKKAILALLPAGAALASILADLPDATETLKTYLPGKKPVTRLDLPLSHPNETWKKLAPDDLPWLFAAWCYQGSASGLTARYRRMADAIEKEDYTRKGRWVTIDAYRSDEGLVRLVNRDTDVHVFVAYEPRRPNLFFENTRRRDAAGTLTTGTKYLASVCPK